MQDSEIIKRLSEAMLKNHESHWDLISRVQNEEPWTGEGIPPAGTMCEMHRETYFEIDWQPVTLLCVGQAKAFFRDKEGHEWSRPLRELSFRPIRTPEQIAAEKREADIEELRMLLSKVACDDYHAAVAMIDSGYHK